MKKSILSFFILLSSLLLISCSSDKDKTNLEPSHKIEQSSSSQKESSSEASSSEKDSTQQEEEKKAQEIRMAEEAAKAEEEARIAEEQRLADEQARIAEEQRLADEQAQATEIAQEQRTVYVARDGSANVYWYSMDSMPRNTRFDRVISMTEADAIAAGKYHTSKE